VIANSIRLLLLLLLVDTVKAQEASTANSKSERTVVFVSDLHMGVGRNPERPSEWDVTEDFRWHAEFESFLDAINRQGQQRVDLVLIGDILELWQSLPGDSTCEYGDDRGCSEEEAIHRACRVIDQHMQVFHSLRDFVGPERDNFITIVPGNHDAALVYPSVGELVLAAIPTESPSRVRMAVGGYWRSTDGKVIAEHGQQIGKDPNRFDGWPLEPFLTVDGKRYLQQTWGENFVQGLFNRYEREYPVIDNLSSETLGVSYATKHLGWMGTTKELGSMVRFLVFEQSWAQATQGLPVTDGEKPKWKIDDINLDSSEARWRFLAQSLDINDPIAEAANNSLRSLPDLTELTRDEIEDACDKRWSMHLADPSRGVELCPHGGGLSAATQSLVAGLTPRVRAAAFRERLNQLRSDVQEEGSGAENIFQTYVYGHTHFEHNACTPFSRQADWKPLVVNDGAWQRTANEEILCALLAGKEEDTDAFAKLKPEDLPGCYPFVIIAPGQPALLRYWVQADAASKGTIKAFCTDTPTIPKQCKRKQTNACPAHPG